MSQGDIIFWGGSGHARVLAELATGLGYRLVAVFDNRPGLPAVAGVPISHGWEAFASWRAEHPQPSAFLCAIGGDRGGDRLEIHERLVLAGLTPVRAIHSTAFVADSAVIAPGCQVLANATVAAEARLGLQTIVNTNASVDHECVLGDGVHIGPGATLSGCVEVGDHTLVGAGAVVLPRIKVGRCATVGAGAVVVDDVPDGVTVVGNPARRLRLRAA